MEELTTQDKTLLVKYTGGQEIEQVVSEEVLPELTAIIRELYANAEPVRLYLEDEALADLLENATGFGIRFRPPLLLSDSSNTMNYILFLTEGKFSNVTDVPDVFFLTAIDAEELIRSPFMTEGGINRYTRLRELLGL